MASRRTRIKGIANIPQRKKPSLITETPSTTDKDNSHEGDTIKNVSINLKSNPDESALLSSESQTNPSQTNSETVGTSEDVNVSKSAAREEDIFIKEESAKYIGEPDMVKKSPSFQNNISLPIKSETMQTSVTDIADPVDDSSTGLSKTVVINRRKFLKPSIKTDLIKPRNVIKTNQVSNTTSLVSQQVDKEYPQSIYQEPNDKVNIVSEVKIPKHLAVSSRVACDITKIISDQSDDSNATYSEIVLDEANFSSSDITRVNSSVVTFSPAKKILLENNVSDTEYPAPPPSPSKLNRARIKAIPKLNMRKTSCSASESEDETRKYGRIRNNSVCSVASATFSESLTPTTETPLPKEVLRIPQKKKNEQVRKLTEAKREFYRRFGTKMPEKPDKQKLKIIDLIFYNPVTNPMSHKESSNKSSSDAKEKTEESVDDPQEENLVSEKDTVNDEDNSLPVPQIKIGPSGEIVLDEQSLIVENVEVAKQKEKILNSNLLDGDRDTSYGVYKRSPRVLPWSQKETLRFYKALNLIGTDFSILSKLFPKRNRRELKIKFKKEEKINRHLIDTAIMRPCTYNFNDLKLQMEIEEREEELLQKIRKDECSQIRQKRKENAAKRAILVEKQYEKTGHIQTNNIESTNGEPQSSLPLKKRAIDEESSLEVNNEKPPKKSRSKKSLSINSVLDYDSDDADDEEEFIPFLKPTRSGRMPKSTLKFIEPEQPKIPRRRTVKKASVDNKSKEDVNEKQLPVVKDTSPALPHMRHRRLSSTSSVESNSDRLVPGSVVITREEGSNGENDYKVFMVTPEKKLTPLQLDSDVVAKLVKEKQAAEFPLTHTLENNVTIPADDDNNSETSESEIVT